MSLVDHHAEQCSATSGEPFKFASEKIGDNSGDVVELPNWRHNGNVVN
jgi:hypothetical protein